MIGGKVFSADAMYAWRYRLPESRVDLQAMMDIAICKCPRIAK